jgi:hypothetical protein
MIFIANGHTMMEVLEKVKLNFGADIAAFFPKTRNTCFTRCQKLAEL